MIPELWGARGGIRPSQLVAILDGAWPRWRSLIFGLKILWQCYTKFQACKLILFWICKIINPRNKMFSYEENHNACAMITSRVRPKYPIFLNLFHWFIKINKNYTIGLVQLIAISCIIFSNNQSWLGISFFFNFKTRRSTHNLSVSCFNLCWLMTNGFTA